MLTNRHKQSGMRGAGATVAPTWPCVPETGRAVVAGLVGVCLSASPAYLPGGEHGLMGAISIENPRFADRRASQNQF